MALRSLERLFLYYPSRRVRGHPGTLGLRYQDVWLAASDGVRLHGWFVPCEGARATLLILHGNGGNIGDRIGWIKLLHGLGLHILIIDYRGYGNSEGEPFEEGLYRDARAAYGWWAGQREGEKLILLGESLGGAVAAHLAEAVSPAGLILQSAFTSARDMAKTMLPLGLLEPLLGVRFDSAEAVARIRCPKLIIHGIQDEVVPFRLGRRLFDLALPPKTFYAVPAAGHNDLPWIAGPEYGRQLKMFLSGLFTA